MTEVGRKKARNAFFCQKTCPILETTKLEMNGQHGLQNQ